MCVPANGVGSVLAPPWDLPCIPHGALHFGAACSPQQTRATQTECVCVRVSAHVCVRVRVRACLSVCDSLHVLHVPAGHWRQQQP